jgi:tRNA (mo5U34)-methyltransferase
MDSTELMDLLQRFRWYQRIRLADGIYTPGPMDSEEKLRLIPLPENLRGKSVLDIGCNEGFFAFEAERRGAAYVLAVDSNNEARKKFHLVKRLLKSNVEFLFLDVTDLNESKIGRFDLTLFFSVFHHLKYPFLALDKVASVTGETAIIEFLAARMKGADVEEPLMVRRTREGPKRGLLPTRALVVERLAQSGFSKVDVVASYWKKRLEGYNGRFFHERVIVKASR